jgi:hypothetical protein
MAKLFDMRTPVIYQDAKPAVFSVERNLQKWILLPLIAYKVLVPYPKPRSLNFFQETVLKLFQSGGRKTAEEIAGKLLLNEQLVKYIIEELKAKDLLDVQGMVTPQGLEAIRDQYSAHEMKIGYVFYDVLSGSYWDTFIFDEEINYIEASPGDRQRNIAYGDVGDPKRERALVIHSSVEQEPEPPDSIRILEICLRHERRMRNMMRADDTGNVDKIRLPKHIEKVKYLGEAKAVYAATMIFIPRIAGGDPAQWQVCHPFRGGVSVRLRQTLDRAKDEPVNFQLKEEMNRLLEQAFEVTDTEREMRRSEIEKKANEYLAGILGEGIFRHRVLHEHLVKLYDVSLALSGLSGSLGKNYDAVQSKISSFIDAVYQLMGNILYAIKQDFGDYFSLDCLVSDPNRNAEILGVIAQKIGFRDHGDGTSFSSMLNVKKGAVAHADEGLEVRSLLAANLLIANEIQEHPFWRLAKRVPQFILFLQDLKRKRDAVTHSVDDHFLYKTVEIMFPRIMYLISILFDGIRFDYDRNNRPEITFADDAEDEFALDMDKKLYHWSESFLDHELGIVIREYPSVRKALIDVQYIHKTGNGNFLTGCSRVLEELLKVWGRNRLDSKAAGLIGTEMERNLAYLRENLMRHGIEFDPGKLPEAFVKVNPFKIRKTFAKFDKGVLSTKLYVILFSECYNQSPMLAEIGQRAPDFIRICAEISDLRKHGSAPLPDEQLKEQWAAKLLKLTKEILPVFEKYSLQGTA